MKTTSLEYRFRSMVDKRGPNECWPWTGCGCRYGQIRKGGHHSLYLGAHRVAWMLANGPIPKGLWVLHHCDNPRCCNPAHLWLGSHIDNMADMVAKGRQVACLGEKNGRAKLTKKEVLAIRRDKGKQRLGKLYGVSQTQIDRIKCGKAWSWLT